MKKKNIKARCEDCSFLCEIQGVYSCGIVRDEMWIAGSLLRIFARKEQVKTAPGLIKRMKYNDK